MDRSRRERELRIIGDLYEDGDPERVASRLCSEHPDLQSEIEVFRATKEALDARRKRRPDRRSLDAVFTEAARPRTEIGRDRDRFRRPDRSAQSRRSARLRSAGVVTALLVAFVGVFSVWQSELLDVQAPAYRSDEATAMKAPSESEAGTDDDVFEKEESSMADLPANDSDEVGADPERRHAEAEQSLDATLDGGVRDELFSASQAGTNAPGDLSFLETYSKNNPSLGEPALLLDDRQNGSAWFSWDEGTDIMDVHQQIEMIRGSVAHGWDPPSVPLEMVPALEQSGGAPPARLLPTGEPRVP